MENRNHSNSENQFQDRVRARIEHLTILRKNGGHFMGKQGRRTPNMVQHHITKMTNLLLHRNACIQGYRAKAAQVKRRKGHNTLSGIPEAFLTSL